MTGGNCHRTTGAFNNFRLTLTQIYCNKGISLHSSKIRLCLFFVWALHAHTDVFIILSDCSPVRWKLIAYYYCIRNGVILWTDKNNIAWAALQKIWCCKCNTPKQSWRLGNAFSSCCVVPRSRDRKLPTVCERQHKHKESHQVFIALTLNRGPL